MLRSILAASLALAALATGPASAHLPPLGPLVAVEVYDRTDSVALPVYEKDGRRYIVGTPGHEYAIRIRNVSSRRVLAVTSVDGVNVVTGETASPQQSGYVLDPWGSVEIAGWRKSLAQTAAFYFTDLRNSYAARTGRPLDVGVIGVAAFPERIDVAAPRDRIARNETAKPESAPLPSAQAPAGANAPAAQGGLDQREQEASAADEARAAPTPPSLARREASKLGTGHGRQEYSPVQQVRFERESGTPAQTYVVQYDRRENLIAMGVLPVPSLARPRLPDPFPAMRFVPDPPR